MRVFLCGNAIGHITFRTLSRALFSEMPVFQSFFEHYKDRTGMAGTELQVHFQLYLWLSKNPQKRMVGSETRLRFG